MCQNNPKFQIISRENPILHTKLTQKQASSFSTTHPQDGTTEVRAFSVETPTVTAVNDNVPHPLPRPL
jgi:hypothetical protein